MKVQLLLCAETLSQGFKEETEKAHHNVSCYGPGVSEGPRRSSIEVRVLLWHCHAYHENIMPGA